MGNTLIRALFIVVSAGSGLLIASVYSDRFLWKIIGLIIGIAVSTGIISLFMRIRKINGKAVLGAIIGLTFGLYTANLFCQIIANIPQIKEHFWLVKTIANVILGYFGLAIGYTKLGTFDIYNLKRFLQEKEIDRRIKVLDTSVIIDGRIYDIADTDFLEGTLVVPHFVLKELQHIADSPDTLKRNRGRRGLDILHKMQKMSNVKVEIDETDFPDIKEVDSKLMELTKRLGGKLITNDFNLNKIAQLHGVTVLNVNELANAVKPVVLPGEEMSVFIVKEGKEPGQGVGYLDDGTMVVVDNAYKEIGNHLDVTVTSVLQTTAGRMIFAKMKEEPVKRRA